MRYSPAHWRLTFLLFPSLIIISVIAYDLILRNITSTNNVSGFHFIALIDTFLAILALSLSIFLFRPKNLSLHLERLKSKIEKRSPLLLSLLLILSTVTFPYFAESLSLILSGCGRNCLVHEKSHSAGIMFFLISPLASQLFALSLTLKLNKKITSISFLFLIYSLIFMASRSQLLFSLLFIAWSYLLYSAYLPSQKLKIPTKAILIILLTSFMVTIFLQKRGDINFATFAAPAEAFFAYRSNSLYLAGHLVANIKNDTAHAIFGYPYDYLRGILEAPRIMTTEFYKNFPLLGHRESGSDLRANVLYPWWAWFYNSLGITGLLLKAIIIFITLSFLLITKKFYIFLLTSFLFVVSAQVKHPLADIASTMTLLSGIVIEITLSATIRKKNAD